MAPSKTEPVRIVPTTMKNIATTGRNVGPRYGNCSGSEVLARRTLISDVKIDGPKPHMDVGLTYAFGVSR
jgi:hypothetical protein